MQPPFRVKWKAVLENFAKLQKQPEVFYKKRVFLEILQSSLENTCARVTFLIK